MILRRGWLWFITGVFLALIAAFIASVSLQKAIKTATKPVEEPRTQALVAARDVPLHTVLSADDVKLQEVPTALMPEDGLTNPSQALGQLTTVDIAKGEIILQRRLIAPDYVGPKAAFAMDPQKVIVAFPAADLLSKAEIVRPGDRVDLMFSLDFGETTPGVETGQNTLTVLQDVQVAAIVGGPQAGEQAAQASTDKNGRTILLAVAPQDALTIKYFRDAGAVADLALRSPAAKGLFDVTPVDGNYLLRRYHIQWQASKQ